MVSYNVLSRWAAQHLNSRPSQKDLSYGSCGLKTKIPWACQEHLSYTISSGSQFVAGAWRLRVREKEGRARKRREGRGSACPRGPRKSFSAPYPITWQQLSDLSNVLIENEENDGPRINYGILNESSEYIP